VGLHAGRSWFAKKLWPRKRDKLRKLGRLVRLGRLQLQWQFQNHPLILVMATMVPKLCVMCHTQQQLQKDGPRSLCQA